MTAFDYVGFRSVAEQLIAEAGQLATLRRRTKFGEDYDPIFVSTDYGCTLVVLSYSDARIDGERIKVGDKRIYLSTKDLAVMPSDTDSIIIGGVEHAIISLEPISPGGTVVAYKAQLRS